MITFQDVILRLQSYWGSRGCAILQPCDMEVGAGTSHTATFLRALGPETWRAGYVQPSRRPKDGRSGDNPNRLQHYYQFQVVLNPSPTDILDLYLGSLLALGLDLQANDARFVVISATHSNIEAEMAAGTFREDLFYRLNVVTLRLPSLAERREDIPLLANHFLAEVARRYKKTVNGLATEAMELLIAAPWPGNVRQLSNLIEQSVALATTPLIPPSLVQQAIQHQQSEYASFEQARHKFEREYLAQLLKVTDGNVTQAARLAKRNRTEFYKLLQRHQLDPKLFKAART